MALGDRDSLMNKGASKVALVDYHRIFGRRAVCDRVGSQSSEHAEIVLSGAGSNS